MSENIFYVVGVVLLLAFVGNVTGGYAEDRVWIAGGQALPECEKIEAEEWREHCFLVNKIYYDVKLQYQTLGTIIPLIFGVIVVWKMV